MDLLNIFTQFLSDLSFYDVYNVYLYALCQGLMILPVCMKQINPPSQLSFHKGMYIWRRCMHSLHFVTLITVILHYPTPALGIPLLNCFIMFGYFGFLPFICGSSGVLKFTLYFQGCVNRGYRGTCDKIM